MAFENNPAPSPDIEATVDGLWVDSTLVKWIDIDRMRSELSFRFVLTDDLDLLNLWPCTRYHIGKITTNKDMVVVLEGVGPGLDSIWPAPRRMFFVKGEAAPVDFNTPLEWGVKYTYRFSDEFGKTLLELECRTRNNPYDNNGAP